MDSSGCGCGLIVSSSAHCNELSASINGEKFLNKMSKCKCPRKKSHEIATRVDLLYTVLKTGVCYIIREFTVFLMRLQSGVRLYIRWLFVSVYVSS